MRMQGSFFVMAALAILALGICASTDEDYYKKNPLDPLEQDTFDSDSPCDVCSNNSTCELIQISVMRDTGSPLQMCVDMFSQQRCCDVVAASNCANYTLDVRALYCLHYVDSTASHIELTNYVLINNLVGVENISEGYNLTLQDRGEGGEDKSRYQMLIEYYNKNDTSSKFSLAFVQPNTKDKYYILPNDSKEDAVPLTIHKDVSPAGKFVFKSYKIPID